MKLHEIVNSMNVGQPPIPKRLTETPITLNPFMVYMKQMEKEKEKKRKKKLSEELEYIKFNYKNYHNDKNPKVKVLDFNYKGKAGQNTYGKRKDILGWNINYVEGGKNSKKEAIRAIDEINDFAELLGTNNKEKYARIVTMFPQVAEYLRRYMKQHISGVKRKPKFLWHKTNLTDLSKG